MNLQNRAFQEFERQIRCYNLDELKEVKNNCEEKLKSNSKGNAWASKILELVNKEMRQFEGV